jgi:hypothetical protein
VLANACRSHGALAGRSHRALAEGKEFVMATIVTGEQYMEIDGKLHEIKRQLRQKNGYPYDLGGLECALQAVVEGRFEIQDPTLPIEIVVGGVTYEIIYFPRGDKTFKHISTIVECARLLDANLGEEDGERFLRHQADIPSVLHDMALFFPGWRNPDPRDHEHIAYILCFQSGWAREWSFCSQGFYRRICCFLRRKSAV